MFRNYLKIAFRNLWRARQFSIINIAGLALGIAVFLFIVQYVATEWSTNRFNKNFDQLYRVNIEYKEGNTEYFFAPGYAPVVKDKFPAIENYVRVGDGIGGGVISYANGVSTQPLVFREDKISYVDNNFFEVFSFPLLQGSASKLAPKTLALSEEMSIKLFGNTDGIGKTITVSNQFGNTLYTVAAVYKNMSHQSDIKSDILLSLETLESPANRDGNDWADPNGFESGYANIYLQLRKDANAKELMKGITEFIHTTNPNSKDEKVFLQPFRDLHIAPSFDYPFQTFGSLSLVVAFSCVAILILLIAWVNYINLSTAQALNRSKEVGVRKVLGANRSQLVLQYLSETFLITLISIGVAILLVELFQPLFNDFAGKQLSIAALGFGSFWIISIALIVVGSLLSGSYVAFVLSSYKPIKAIKGQDKTIKTFSLRKGLVVFQFTISIVFIIATIVLYKQLQFMNNQSLGMNLNQLLVIKGPTISSEGQAAKNISFKTALGQLPFVKSYAASNNVPGQGFNFSTEQITKINAQKGDERKSYSMFIADQNFFSTYGISFAQGRTFSTEEAERSWNNLKKVVINEKAAASLGFAKGENIVGQKIVWDKDQYEVIGVVKDYHHLSLREAIKPTIYLGSVSFVYFTVKMDLHNLPSKLASLKTLYTEHFGNNPFDYFFAGDLYDQQYNAEQKLGKVFVASAFVAILIACMGLFGLAAFSAQQRVKEIGIRKVLGASLKDITGLLTKDFIKLLVIAIVIASPIAWWVMQKWLQDFAYRADVSWWIFFVAGAIAIFIAMATISYQALKAATANPVKSLRTE